MQPTIGARWPPKKDGFGKVEMEEVRAADERERRR